MLKKANIIKRISQALILLFCLLPLWWLLKTQRVDLLLSISWQTAVFCILTLIGSYLCSGMQYYLNLKQLGYKFEYADILLFPFTQGLWGLIIPFQGASIFALFFMKTKYKLKMTDSVAIILFLYFFNFIFGGIAGLFYAVYSGRSFSLLSLFSLLALGLPLYLWIAYCLFRKNQLAFVPEKYRNMVMEFFHSLHVLAANVKILALLLTCQVLRQLVSGLGYTVAARGFQIDVNWLWGYLVAVSQEIMLILKFTPGNIGLAEIVTGFVGEITGVPFADGIMTSVYYNFWGIMLCILIGATGTWMFMKKLQMPWGDLLACFRKTTPDCKDR